MSNSVEVDRVVNVTVDFVECSDCGANLVFSLSADGHGDLEIKVDRCDCKDEEFIQQGRDEE